MPVRPPGGALHIIGQNRVDARVGVERPARLCSLRQAQASQDSPPDQIASTVDGVRQRDTEALFGRPGRHR